jgi:ribosomal protein S18 acetylase RimI-like enzyme
MKIELIKLDYHNTEQTQDMLSLLNTYAQDPMGGGAPLSQHVKDNLIKSLGQLPSAFSIMCYVDNKPAGLANCFHGFSTFKCKPLINIHDLAVDKQFRGLGISQKLLTEIENIANQNGCCKITLEVLEGNQIAKNAYLKFGFAGYELDPQMGKAMFWEKTL